MAAADAFFRDAGSGRLKEAYESASFSFQAQQTQKFFEQSAKEMGVLEFVSASWEQPEMDRNSAKIRGEITTKSGRKVPVVVTLTEESGNWRVYSIKSPRSLETGSSVNLFGTIGRTTAFTSNIDRPLPDEAALKKLTLESLLMFNDAVKQKSFAEFYEKVSRTWQQQLTLGQLQRAFQPFIDKEVDISGINGVDVVFDPPPQVSTDGLLVITGTYPTTPYRVAFSLKFLYELPTWKLFGIDINLQK